MVKWTEHAITQLRHIHNYIAENSPFYAKRVSEDLVKKTQLLDEFPRIGKVVAELNEETIRELALYSYRVLYEINTANVEILAVIHKRQHLKAGDLTIKN